MEQLLEFVSNHALLAGGFVAVLLLLLWTEFGHRTQRFQVLAPQDAVMMMNRDQPVIVDVSAAADFNKGHITGARNIPMSRLRDPDAEVQKLTERPVLVVCKSGQAATQAASSLVKLGTPGVAVLKGGMSQWLADHYPVSKK